MRYNVVSVYDHRVNTPNTNNIKAAFTPGVRDSRVESSHTMLAI
jgi:hypothetical protein